jgi:hypothetical protein
VTQPSGPSDSSACGRQTAAGPTRQCQLPSSVGECTLSTTARPSKADAGRESRPGRTGRSPNMDMVAGSTAIVWGDHLQLDQCRSHRLRVQLRWPGAPGRSWCAGGQLFGLADLGLGLVGTEVQRRAVVPKPCSAATFEADRPAMSSSIVACVFTGQHLDSAYRVEQCWWT